MHEDLFRLYIFKNNQKRLKIIKEHLLAALIVIR